MLQLKLCCQCYAAYEAVITECPCCDSQVFRDITIEELVKITPGDKIRVYFIKWPNWPSDGVWRDISNLKSGLEQFSRKTFFDRIFRRFFKKKKSRQ